MKTETFKNKFLIKLKYVIKYNEFVYTVYYYLLNSILKFLNTFIKKENSILFVCYGGRKYDDSPRIFYEYLRDNNILNDYKMIWAFENVEQFSDFDLPNVVEINSIKYLFVAMKSKFWITNSSIQRGLNFKNSKNMYVNFQHGTLGIKKIGKSINSNNNSFKSKTVEKFDCFIIQGKHEKKWLAEDLEIDINNIHLVGLPRNIELYNVSQEDKINAKKMLGLPLDKKAILYAPTFRETHVCNSKIDYVLPFNLEDWKQNLSNQYVMILTNHYETNNFGNVISSELDDFVYEFFNMDEINKLILAADILITDYSSITFDAFVAEIPVLCYAYDYNDYFSQRGSTYIDLSKLFSHGPIKTESQLLSTIINIDYKKEIDFSKKQKEKYIYCNDNVLIDCYNIIFERDKKE